MKGTSTNAIRTLELLSPAKNAETAIAAIKHGADAVYIGGPDFGARKNASNRIEDIKQVVDFAHIFRAKVYVTLNTILFDNELSEVEQLIRRLYEIGVDALIVQDMSILRLDIPPIPLHASTQCDNRNREKAIFLQECGFSQIVLARELSLSEIEEICRSVTVPVECFVHGALCVSYSGRCHASHARINRSANRGRCAQLCRLPYNLMRASDETLIKNRHLLSLKDLNLSSEIEKMALAGVRSFKIEGRLKDTDYVKNVTSAYSDILDKIVNKYPDRFRRESYGSCERTFIPDLNKSFNRSFTHYFFDSVRPAEITSPFTPKSLGEEITDISQLHNGDGISYFDNKNNHIGGLVNGISNGRIRLSNRIEVPKDVKIHRTSDIEWDKTLAKDSSTRKIAVEISIDRKGVSAADERGVRVRIAFDEEYGIASKPQNYRQVFSKLGSTNYRLKDFHNNLDEDIFIPASRLTALRRDLISHLDSANLMTLTTELRREENPDVNYISDHLGFEENVANRLAERFYKEHGVKSIIPAIEKEKIPGDIRVMTTRHCILREMGRCRKTCKERIEDPLYLVSEGIRMRVEFDCDKCEMHLFMTQ